MPLNPFDEAIEELPDAPDQPPAAVNPYDEIVAAHRTEKDARLRSTTLQATQTPDRAAEARTFGARFGLPPSVIESNFDAFKQRAQLEDVSAVGRVAPKLGAWLAADPGNASVAADDHLPLSALERTLSFAQRAIADPAISLLKGAIGIPEALLGLADIGDALSPTAALERAMGVPARPSPGKVLEDYGFQPGLAKTILSTFYSKAQAGAFTSVQQADGAIATAVAALSHPSVIAHSVLESVPLMLSGTAVGAAAPLLDATIAGAVGEGLAQAGSAAEQSRQASPTGSITPGQAGLAASSGAVTGALGVFGGKLASKLGIADVDTLLAGAAVSSKAQRGLVTQVVLGAIEEGFLEELPQSISEQVHQNAADGRPLMEGVDNAAVMGALAGAVMGGGAQVQQRFVEHLGKVATESKTIKRSPEAAQAFLAQATKDGPLETLYQPVDTWKSYWESKGQDPAQMAAELTGSVDAYAQALATGQDLEIPTARYAVKLAATEHNAFFANELRLKPDEMNAREAEAFQKAVTDQGEQPTPEVSPIRTALLQQLTQAGVEPSTAESYATLYESAIGSVAERAGVDPAALYEKYGLTVERPGLQGEQPATEPATPSAPTEDERLAGKRAIFAMFTAGNATVEDAAQNVTNWQEETNQRGEPMNVWRGGETVGIVPASQPSPLKNGELIGTMYPETSDTQVAPIGETTLAQGAAVAAPVEDQLVLDGEPVNQTTDAAGIPLFDQPAGYVGTIGERRYATGPAPGGVERRATIDQPLPENRGQRVAQIQAEFARGENRSIVAGAVKRIPAPPRTVHAVASEVADMTAREYGQPLFHGSPHDFAQFTTTKMGTGEGHQAFGWGLYFAENPDVAGDYQRALAHAEPLMLDGQPWRQAKRLSKTQRQLLEAIEANNLNLTTPDGGLELPDALVRLARESGGQQQWTAWIEAWEKLTNKFNVEQAEPQGFFYQVEIPDEHIAKMLDWDKPFSEQPQSVRDALEGLDISQPTITHQGGTYYVIRLDGEALGSSNTLEQAEANAASMMTGEAIYQRLSGKLGDDRAASAALREAGVPGLRFLDQGSRARTAAWGASIDDGTRNVVVFDDAIITVTHKDGTPVTAKERTEFFQPLKGDGEEKRGAIRFGADRQFTISLLEKADLTTFVHESAHFFLEVLGDLHDQVSAQEAQTPEQQQLRDDYATLLKWFGAENRAGITTEHHEQFARGFESYLASGSAPSVALQSAFSRFRAWILGVYQNLKNLNVTLTPDVRGVLDRLVASDQAIADAEAQRNVAPMFTTPESAGMTPQEFALYAKTIADASRTARETLDAQLMKDVRREQTATWKAQREATREIVEGEVHQQPVYRALAAMQKGTHPNGESLVEGQAPEPLKLSKAAIVERYGKERLATLPKPYVYTVDGGMDPNLVAEMFGFSSGDELLTAITQAPPMKAVIDQQTSARMIAEHGSLLLDGTLHEKARAAVENEDREKVIRAELAALNKLRRTVDPFVKLQRQAGRASASQIVSATPSAQMLKAAAEQKIAGMQVRAIKPQTYWSASRRAAKLAFEAAAKQDVVGAITAKNQELTNLAFYREATRALEDVNARVQFATDLGKTASRKRLGLAGSTYLDQVDGVLDRFEFATVPKKTLDRRARIRDWMEAVAAQGIPVEDLPPEILDDARRVNYKELTVDELVGVTDGLKQILHLARLKNKLLASTDERAFDAIRDGVSSSILDQNPTRTKVLEFRPSDQKWRAVAGWFASHTKIAMLARALDGHQDAGPLWQALIRPINAAADAETTRKSTDGTAYAKILEAAYPGRELGTLNEKLFIPALNGSLSKEGRLAVALNWGNQTSRDRILADPNRQWTEPQVRAILDTLDERDWNFVQSTWDFINGYWDEIADKQQRVTGLAPEKVDALQVETKFGAFRGGYYPLAYDGRLSPRADQHAAATEAKLAVAGAYVSSTTRRGHTKARMENVKLSVRLELGVAFNHIESVIHDLTHHEMLIDTTRLLRDPAIRDAILDTKGDQVYEQFTTALQDIALGSSNGAGKQTVLDKSAAWMKTGTQLSGLGWNLWTAAQQPLGIFNGMSRVGPTWVMKGMARWLRDAASMESTSKWIADVSPMMRERVTTGTQDLHDLKASIRQPGGWFDTLVRTVSADHLTQQTIVDSYLWHIGLMQRVADIPTWLGGYEKAMAAGHDEATAIALADQGVLDSQGGGQVKDLAGIQRGGPVAKLFLTFYSYGNTVYNSTADVAGATNFKSPAQVATFLGHLSLLYLMPAVGTVALSRLFGKSGGGDDDWDKLVQDIGRESLSSAMNTMVLVRELGGLVQEGTRGYAGPAGTRMIELAYNLGKQVKQGEVDEALFKAINSAAGVIFRYPAGQVGRTVDGWVALQDHRTANPAALLFGAPKKAAQ